MYEPKEHERLFGVRPIGVKYICEFCNEGEMKVSDSSSIIMTDPPLYLHKCTKCGKTMQLPKVYPYIEWNEITHEEVIEETMDIVKSLHEELNKLERTAEKE